MRERTMSRYGVCCDIPERLPGYPEPKALYTGQDGVNAVEEHGLWCLSQMIGDAHHVLPVPKSSGPIYEANQARVASIMAAYA